MNMRVPDLKQEIADLARQQLRACHSAVEVCLADAASQSASEAMRLDAMKLVDSFTRSSAKLVAAISRMEGNQIVYAAGR